MLARTQYDERPVLASDLSFEGEVSLTKQGDLKDSDINLIFRRFEKTGRLPDMIVRTPRYGDFSDVPSYQEACEIVRHADEQFANLDVKIRNQFDNDPAKFLAFATDPANVDKLEEMGLLKPEVVEARRVARKAKEDELNAASIAQRNIDERKLIDKIKAELQGN